MVKGKSVLMSQIASFVSADSNKRVMFFFCDYHTPAYAVPTQIFKAYLAQCISQNPGIVPFLYDEYLAKGHLPVAKMLKPALISVLKSMDCVRLIVDGVDEVQPTEQKLIIRELTQFTKLCGDTCKLLIASQDLPTIRLTLRGVPYLFLGDERPAIEKDMRVVVEASLTELDESLNDVHGEMQVSSLVDLIVNKAEGEGCCLYHSQARISKAYSNHRHVSLGQPDSSSVGNLFQLARVTFQHQ